MIFSYLSFVRGISPKLSVVAAIGMNWLRTYAQWPCSLPSQPHLWLNSGQIIDCKSHRGILEETAHLSTVELYHALSCSIEYLCIEAGTLAVNGHHVSLWTVGLSSVMNDLISWQIPLVLPLMQSSKHVTGIRLI